MLNTAIAKADLSRTLLGKGDFHPFARYEERERWQALAPEIRSYYKGIGESLIGCDWPEMPASLYMDFVRNGNRSRFEKPHFERRRRLYSLLIAECIEGKGRMVDDIINGVWAICEESTWVLPAHNNQVATRKTFNHLVDLEETPLYVDLFSAETASLLSWVYALMGARLAEESPLVPRRIEMEVSERVLEPYLARDDFGWMGLAHNNPVNNWNPWINSNVLAAALNIEADAQKREALAVKIGRSAQRFLDFYAPDGGCDEGPGYFNVAGASLLDVLGLYEDGTRGAVNIYAEPLIQNMGKYIMYAHIAGPWHVNFADAAARVQPDAMLLWRAGIKTGQDDLVAYAKGALANGFAALPYQATYNTIYRRLMNLFAFDPAAFEGAPLIESREHYFPGIEVVSARSKENSDEGLFFAAKGGHNAESHNHNDIGNYIIAVDGMPVIADAGVGEYTKFTFNEMRYTIWTMQSQYHNTAVINGCNQLPGKAYAAKDAAYAADEKKVAFKLDMAAAYPKEAGARQYLRQITFDRAAGTIAVKDEAKLSKAEAPTVLPLLSAAEPVLGDGTVRFSAGGRTLALRYDPALFTAQTERIPLTDSRLYASWELGSLYRTLLTRKEAKAEDAYELVYAIEG